MTRMLEIHFKKSAVVILDEYDVPIAKASATDIIRRCWT